jgi:hypothetical protein
MRNIHVLQENIYITSDEEIKEVDWYISFLENEVYKATKETQNIMSVANLVGSTSYKKTHFKIILTTDQDLIKDGVQAIDDEFLEWFVKNPSCEEVKVEESNLLNTSRTYLGVDKYKIIIPKEEPKQETLEEAIEQYSEIYRCPATNKNEYCRHDIISAVKFGAKWQQERSYSEEEFLEFSEWVSHNDWVYLPSKGYWVNEEQEESEQKFTTKELLEIFKNK